jgi:hypothetical protein
VGSTNERIVVIENGVISTIGFLTTSILLRSGSEKTRPPVNLLRRLTICGWVQSTPKTNPNNADSCIKVGVAPVVKVAHWYVATVAASM